MTTVSPLRDLLESTVPLTAPVFNKLDDRKIVELLLNSFPDAHLDVDFSCNPAVTCDFFTGDLCHFRIRLWEKPNYQMILDEVSRGDGSDPSDWVVQEGVDVRTMNDVIGWVSWIHQQLPPRVPHPNKPPEYRMPNLQKLCWHYSPIPRPPFIKIALGSAIYEESPTTRWVIRFPRPGRDVRPEAYITLLRDPPQNPRTQEGIPPQPPSYHVRDIEAKANEILRGFPVNQAGVQHPFPSDSIFNAIMYGINEVECRTRAVPDLILMNPKMLSTMLKSASMKTSFFTKTETGNGLYIRGIKLVAHPLVLNGDIIFTNANQESIYQITVSSNP